MEGGGKGAGGNAARNLFHLNNLRHLREIPLHHLREHPLLLGNAFTCVSTHRGTLHIP